MKIIMGNVWQPTSDGSTVTITRAMSDPVPTCSLSLEDTTSSIFPQAMQELLVLDDQMIPNPTVNMLQNPSLNPYTTSWTTPGSFTINQVGGGGISVTFTNAPFGDITILQQTLPVGSLVPGQQYVFSVYAQGSGTVVNASVYLNLNWGGIAFRGSNPISNTLTRYSLVATAPPSAAGVASVTVTLGFTTFSATNSGTISWTQPQFEPLWFPTLSYPTPWCGPSQTNCQQLPNGLWIRQYRKFAGFVNHATYDSYKGNVRTVHVDAVGYAWLMSLVICNNSYTNQADSAIFSNLLSTYFPNMFTTTNVVTGVTLSSYVSNWDDIRTLLDGLASQIGYYWTVDYYWNTIYAPPGYFSMPISLICDNSSNPDMVTTFPAYDFSAEMDYTQPGSVALVIGSGTNVAEVIDPSTTAQNGIIAGYSFKTGSTFMRKVNDTTLQSVNDCTQRGLAELLQYDYPRAIYHLTTNVELIPGQSIQITSNTDNLNQDTQLIQQVTATWLGVSETLDDTWEYKADLGAVNRAATHIISRLARKLNSNSSAPAISATTLAVIEQIGLTDSLPSIYAKTILADSPLAYYRLGEPSGITAYDWSGNTSNGTLNNSGGNPVGVTLGQPGAIYNDPSTSMLFDGSSGYIALPSGVNVSGFTAITVEMWVNLATQTFSNFPRLIANDQPGGTQKGVDINLNTNGAGGFWIVGNGTTHATLSWTTPFTAGIWSHVVATYDSANLRVYVNGVQVATTAFAGGAIGTPGFVFNIARNPQFNGAYFPGYLDECAIYNYALSAAQVLNHYKTGKGIK